MYYEDGDRGSSRKYYERGTYGPYKVGARSGIVIGTTPTRRNEPARALRLRSLRERAPTGTTFYPCATTETFERGGRRALRPCVRCAGRGA